MSHVQRHYFDWNATAPLRPQARAAVLEALSLAGNASSIHAEGRAARALVEKARAEVAELVGADARNVTFTSGATEASALALTPAIEVGADKASRDVLLVSAIEHPSVLAGGHFATVATVAVDADGRLDLAALADALKGTQRPLVSIMLANNETGVIQPVAAAAELVHAAGGLLHVDAVQGAGRMACDMAALGADLMSLSSHKIGGPQGAGALVRRDGLHLPHPLIRGGGQERGLRAGTENVAAIAGFGAAASAARQNRAEEAARMSILRERFEAAIAADTPSAVVFGRGVERLPNTVLVAMPGVKAETALIAFDLNGIAVSSGAACSSGKVQASHVLAAMGVPAELSAGAIRVSLGWEIGDEDIEVLVKAWRKVAVGLSKGRGMAA